MHDNPNDWGDDGFDAPDDGYEYDAESCPSFEEMQILREEHNPSHELKWEDYGFQWD